jgi:hypothetical protein
LRILGGDRPSAPPNREEQIMTRTLTLSALVGLGLGLAVALAPDAARAGSDARLSIHIGKAYHGGPVYHRHRPAHSYGFGRHWDGVIAGVRRGRTVCFYHRGRPWAHGHRYYHDRYRLSAHALVRHLRAGHGRHIHCTRRY